MAYIGKVNIDNTAYQIGSTLYLTCSTAANTAAKTVSATGFTLENGVTVHVKFVNSNTASNPTLNINNTGDKPIMRFGITPAGSTSGTSWLANAVVTLTYDGTNWMMNGSSSEGQINTIDADGVVPAGLGHGNRIWETDEIGNPDWRDPNMLYTDIQIDYQTGYAVDGEDKDLYNSIYDFGWADEIFSKSTIVFFKKDTSGSSISWKSIPAILESGDEVSDGRFSIIANGDYEEACTGFTFIEGTGDVTIFESTDKFEILSYAASQVSLTINDDSFTVTPGSQIGGHNTEVLTLTSSIGMSLLSDQYIAVTFRENTIQ